MPSRDQVLELLGQGHGIETAARELRIPAGQAYMIATGRAADDGDPPSPEVPPDERLGSDSPQELVNPPAMRPTRNARVIEWVRERAARELSDKP